MDAAALLRVLGASADDVKHGVPKEAAHEKERPHRVHRLGEALARGLAHAHVQLVEAGAVSRGEHTGANYCDRLHGRAKKKLR